MIREFVECESPSDSPGDVKRFMDLLAESVSRHRRVGWTPTGALICKIRTPGRRKKQGQLLALGHADTVWPIGTLKTMPFRRAQGRLWGPGVLDMKAGLAFFIFAMRALCRTRNPGPSRSRAAGESGRRNRQQRFARGNGGTGEEEQRRAGARTRHRS